MIIKFVYKSTSDDLSYPNDERWSDRSVDRSVDWVRSVVDWEGTATAATAAGGSDESLMITDEFDH